MSRGPSIANPKNFTISIYPPSILLSNQYSTFSFAFFIFFLFTYTQYKRQNLKIFNNDDVVLVVMMRFTFNLS